MYWNFFFFSSRRPHRRLVSDWSSDVCSSDLGIRAPIEQVEIGTDAPDFPTALRAAVRQAPDVIVVGEMRDAESMRIAVAAAETEHLVLSTLHKIGRASGRERGRRTPPHAKCR